MDEQREVVVVTGASGGVGRAVARIFGEHGAAVGLLARGVDGLAAARQEIERAGGAAIVLPTDVADAEQVELAAAEVERQLGPIDIWVNDAMATVFAPIWELTAEEFRRATEVTYLGAVYGTQAALRRMLPRDRGTIVQVGSALAHRSIPLQSPYCGAKHAIIGFTDSIRSELLYRKSRVHVTVVNLPGVNTPQFDWGRNKMPMRPQPVPPIYQPEVPAREIYWAAHHRRREVDVGFSTLKAVIGNKFIPGLLDRYLARKVVTGQQTSEPRRPDEPDNLFSPVPGDHGAHGRFDERARAKSPESWLSRHKWAVAAGLALAGGATLARVR
ncbi:MAG TPA: SDR family oxidoreductase [Polyangia bacterium]|nr:SDR family oxidoreductase [Polyangia bacterium]